MAAVEIGRITAEELQAALNTLRACIETVRDVGTCTRGALYSSLMSIAGMTYPAYERLEALMIDTGLVGRRGDELFWRDCQIRDMATQTGLDL